MIIPKLIPKHIHLAWIEDRCFHILGAVPVGTPSEAIELPSTYKGEQLPSSALRVGSVLALIEAAVGTLDATIDDARARARDIEIATMEQQAAGYDDAVNRVVEAWGTNDAKTLEGVLIGIRWARGLKKREP